MTLFDNKLQSLHTFYDQLHHTMMFQFINKWDIYVCKPALCNRGIRHSKHVIYSVSGTYYECQTYHCTWCRKGIKWVSCVSGAYSPTNQDAAINSSICSPKSNISQYLYNGRTHERGIKGNNKDIKYILQVQLQPLVHLRVYTVSDFERWALRNTRCTFYLLSSLRLHNYSP